jgi:quercetin dioxygenase-like cupin family protein
VAATGDRFEMPDGSVYEVTAAAADSGGAWVGMNFIQPRGAVPPPPHIHPTQTEEFEVLDGPFELMVNGAWRTLQTSEKASVPPGVPHTFKNRSGGTMVVHSVHRPPGRFEDFIEHLYELLRARGIKSGKDPRVPVYISMVMLEYGDTLRPGRDRERFAINVIARLGRVLRLDTEVAGREEPPTA